MFINKHVRRYCAPSRVFYLTNLFIVQACNLTSMLINIYVKLNKPYSTCDAHVQSYSGADKLSECERIHVQIIVIIECI